MATSDHHEEIFNAHSFKQDQAIHSDAKITLLLTGLQFGKTTAGALWLKRYMHAFFDPAAAFLITAPNYKIMQQSTLPAFLKSMDGLGEYNKTDAMFRMYHGGTCYMRTSTDPNSVVGLTNVRAIWGDEAGMYSLFFWENLQGRASFRDCPILLTTTPYASNWLYKDVVKKTKDKKRDDVLLVEASSNENPYFPPNEMERRRKTMDPRRFAAMYLGQFEKMHGLVYDCFDEEVHVMDSFALPTGTKYYAGVDWGYTEPFVMTVRAITPDGYHFQVSEFYKTGMTITDMVIAAKQKKQIYGIQTFYADPSQPGYIEEFNRNGLTCVPADNDIRRGIDLHYDLIKTGKFHIFKDSSPYTLDEISAYRYPEPAEIMPDKDSKEQKPVGQDDHCMDSFRYCTISTYRSTLKTSPIIHDETRTKVFERNHEKRIQELRKKKTFKNSENFS